MHLRIVKARSGTEVREYAQLVQSYRRPDGVTGQRVLGSLGRLTALEVHNLRCALEASRRQLSLSLPESVSAGLGDTTEEHEGATERR